MLSCAGEPMFVRDVAADRLNRSVAEFGNVELDCEHTGRPSPNITWQRNGNSLPNVNQSPKLNLSNVEIQNGGHYVCTVANGLGTITREYVIAVVGKATH